jgi:superfamily II RNA helicase
MTDSSAPTSGPPRPRLRDRIDPRLGGDAALDAFVAWVTETGLSPYPAQEEALLELWSGRHVVLSTPTGSGKSLVALGLHFKALCEGRRSFYTAPIKALASEKFFALCDELGAENVGMLTGDASINWAAPVVCCTAEVLMNLALRRGESADAPYVVMDEFHYYADPERGVAWQVPLLALPRTTFLLMSATLGNTRPIEERLERATGRPVAHVHSEARPVPLDFEYCETPIHETVEALLDQGRAPVYVVHFTQREAALRAQALTSARIASREQRDAIAVELGGFRFDSPYGKDVQRFLRHGVGLHHAGLLPKYRLLVEQLAQRGLLRVVCGTDTLGVGVNVPIRTVLFSALSKYDGEKVRLLSVREFRQIAGRAGRKGFDERGWVVCQAPEHVIENQRAAAKTGGGRKRTAKARPPPGFVGWDRKTFERLAWSPPETLESRFRVTHGMLVALLQRGEEEQLRGSGYRLLAELIGASHESHASRRALRRQGAAIFRSLRRAGLVQRVAELERGGARVRVAPELQRDFSLHHSLSPYLVEAVAVLDPESPNHPMDVLSIVEAILEDPRPILAAQVQRAKQELVARLKAEGVPYEERIERLGEVTHPKPLAEFLWGTFRLYVERHPWAAEEHVRPKSVAREMWEHYDDFADYVRRYGIERSEGLLLRYLSQVHNTLVHSVPESARSEPVYETIGFLRALLARVDSSLVEEWESLVHPGEPRERPSATAAPRQAPDLARHPKALAARIRAEMNQLVRALATGRFEDAAACVRQDSDDPWDAARFEAALAPFLAEYGRIVFDPHARLSEHTSVQPLAARRFAVRHKLLDPAGDGFWYVDGEVDLAAERAPEGPLVEVRAIRT